MQFSRRARQVPLLEEITNSTNIVSAIETYKRVEEHLDYWTKKSAQESLSTRLTQEMAKLPSFKLAYILFRNSTEDDWLINHNNARAILKTKAHQHIATLPTYEATSDFVDKLLKIRLYDQLEVDETLSSKLCDLIQAAKDYRTAIDLFKQHGKIDQIGLQGLMMSQEIFDKAKETFKAVTLTERIAIYTELKEVFEGTLIGNQDLRYLFADIKESVEQDLAGCLDIEAVTELEQAAGQLPELLDEVRLSFQSKKRALTPITRPSPTSPGDPFAHLVTGLFGGLLRTDIRTTPSSPPPIARLMPVLGNIETTIQARLGKLAENSYNLGDTKSTKMHSDNSKGATQRIDEIEKSLDSIADTTEFKEIEAALIKLEEAYRTSVVDKKAYKTAKNDLQRVLHSDPQASTHRKIPNGLASSVNGLLSIAQTTLDFN